MVVLALAAVILCVGAPSFAECRANNRLTGAANDYLAGILPARSEAPKRQTPVALCPSDDSEDPDATCSDGALTGWITFVDANNDCLRDDGEEVLRAQPTLDEAVLTDSDGVCLSFAANSFRHVIAGRATLRRTLFCDERGNAETFSGSGESFARGIRVQPTGRANITRNRVAIATWSTVFGVACP